MRTLDDARHALRGALDDGDLPAARKALRGLPPLRGPEVGLLWAELLWADRERPDRRAIAETLLDAFPDHGEIVHPCAEVLLDELGGYVPGDPPDPHGLARRVVAAVDGCLDARPEYDAVARAHLRRTRAAALSRCRDAPASEVEAAWEEVLSARPDDGPTWYELALWLKYRGTFRAALAAALQAWRCVGPQRAVLWNVGICATGCGAHDRALEAWQALGVDAALRDGRVIVLGLPPRRVRLVSTDPVYGRPGERVILEVEVEPLGPCDGVLACDVPSDVGDALPGLGAGARILHDGTPLPGSEPPCLPAIAVLG